MAISKGFKKLGYSKYFSQIMDMIYNLKKFLN